MLFFVFEGVVVGCVVWVLFGVLWACFVGLGKGIGVGWCGCAKVR